MSRQQHYVKYCYVTYTLQAFAQTHSRLVHKWLNEFIGSYICTVLDAVTRVASLAVGFEDRTWRLQKWTTCKQTLRSVIVNKHNCYDNKSVKQSLQTWGDDSVQYPWHIYDAMNRSQTNPSYLTSKWIRRLWLYQMWEQCTIVDTRPFHTPIQRQQLQCPLIL